MQRDSRHAISIVTSAALTPVMPCNCFHRTVGAFQLSQEQRHTLPALLPKSRRLKLNRRRGTSPAQSCGQTQARRHCRSPQARLQQHICRAQKQDDKKRDIVGGFDVDAPDGLLESEAVGIAFKVCALLATACRNTCKKSNLITLFCCHVYGSLADA